MKSSPKSFYFQMRLEGCSIASRVSSSASVPSASGEIDPSSAIDFLAFSGTSLSVKSLSLMNLFSKNSVSRASMMAWCQDPEICKYHYL